MNKTLKRSILVMVVLLCMVAVPNAIWASDKEDGILRFNIPVITGAERFVDTLEYPAYIAIALQNNGIRPGMPYEVKIKDHQTFEIKGIEFKFIKKDENLFFYQAKISGFPGNAVPIVDLIIDTSMIHNGVITLSASSSIVKILPLRLRDMIKAKVQQISDEHNQKKIVEYFNKLSSTGYGHNKIQVILEGIMIDAYNMHINLDGQLYKADTELSELNYYSVFIYVLVVFLIIIIIYMRANK